MWNWRWKNVELLPLCVEPPGTEGISEPPELAGANTECHHRVISVTHLALYPG